MFNEALRVKYEQTGDAALPGPGRPPNGRLLLGGPAAASVAAAGCPGHAEMAGKTLFLKSNTGPSGPRRARRGRRWRSRSKRAGADGVKVFVLEGEGGLTPGAAHETANSAYGLALDNLVLPGRLERLRHRRPPGPATSSTAAPRTGSRPHGWKVFGAEDGSDWEPGERSARGTMVRVGQSRQGAERGLGEDPQGPGLPEVRQRLARRAARDEQRAVLGDRSRPFAEKYGAVFANFGGAGARADARRVAGRVQGEPQGGGGRASAATRPWSTTWPTAWSSSATASRRASRASSSARARQPLRRSRACTISRGYPGRSLRRARREDGQPERPGPVGRLGQRLRGEGVRPAAVPGLLGRPRRLDEHRRASPPAYGDFKGYGWYERVGSEDGVAAAPGDHRVRQHGRSWPGRRRSTSRRTPKRPSTASGAPPRRTGPSRTSSTGPCGYRCWSSFVSQLPG
ncbi:MAG: hypothetical protein M0C28_06320 [Candidatus Moduliflexus flocculans]|nr:hypothetical protein [Candidatus Moduliflexus flocculans]